MRKIAVIATDPADQIKALPWRSLRARGLGSFEGDVGVETTDYLPNDMGDGNTYLLVTVGFGVRENADEFSVYQAIEPKIQPYVQKMQEILHCGALAVAGVSGGDSIIWFAFHQNA